MTVDITHDKVNDILVVTVSGELSLEILKEAAQKIVSSDQFAPNIATLWDLRQLDADNINQNFLSNLVSLREKQFQEREGAKLALVANSDLIYGLSRMYEMLSNGLPQSMHVFRTIDEAMVWLLSDR